jgi:hypothetical protein
MFCRTCGTKADEGDRFCGACGTVLTPPATDAGAAIPVTTPDPPVTEPPPPLTEPAPDRPGVAAPETPATKAPVSKRLQETASKWQQTAASKWQQAAASKPQQADTSKPQQADASIPLSVPGLVLCGGAAAIAIAALLPWADASAALGVTVSTKPPSGGVFLLFILAGVLIWVGWPALRGHISPRRCIGLAVVAGVISVLALTNWAGLGNLQDENPTVDISPGSGLLLYTLGVAVIWVGVVLAFRMSRAQPETSS